MAPNLRLRDLIRNIRACKTAADERGVVSKECALIRTAFKDEDVEYRTRNVAKVLYIHMLGYPAHFGQLEVLKLIASPKFLDKRLGYLGAMMLLDERTDVHLLLTNSIKLDLNSKCQYICCTALCTLGNICSSEMARDLSSEVEKLLKSSNALIRKKAALCACRIIRKVPDLLENFLPTVRQLLNERNHGVLLTGVTLLTEMCLVSNDTLDYSRRMVPNLVRILKTLVMSGFTPDHDVGGITDPFLQIKILRLLGILGHNDVEASDAMNDILAQVATNTESAKNAGNAILYEAVRTIMKIKAESGLRVFAINILGRFLLNNDKNIRYVALNSLMTSVHGEMKAVQRHRDTVVDCLKDLDISIRRRALELIFALINDSNIRALTREVLGFLEVADTEFRPYICSQMVYVCAKHSPNKRWHVDTIMKCLTLAGKYVSAELVTVIVQTLAGMEELHEYLVQRLVLALQDDISAQSTVQIAVWCIGEFGELLIGGHGEDSIDISEGEVLDLFENILISSYTTKVTKEYVLTSLLKLSTRFNTGTNRIRKMIEFYSTSMDIELQQRAVEYDNLFDNGNLREALLERMPIKEIEEEEKYSDDESGDYHNRRSSRSDDKPRSPDRPSSQGQEAPEQSNLMDLLDIGGSDSSPAPSQQPAQSGGSNLLDLLGDMTPSSAPAPSPNSGGGGGGLLDLLGDSPASAPIPTPQMNGKNVYNNNGIVINIINEPSNNPQVSNFTTLVMNSNASTADSFAFQVAVPKTLKLRMLPASGTSVPENNSGTLSQKFQIANPQGVPIRLRVKISYNVNGQQISEQQEISDI